METVRCAALRAPRSRVLQHRARAALTTLHVAAHEGVQGAPEQSARCVISLFSSLSIRVRAQTGDPEDNPYGHLLTRAHIHTDSIIVRAYEDRADLLRSLIIGPENTPYEDAPFVIDWMLDSNFPQTPPIAHFLSWTNGNGRGASVDPLSALIGVGSWIGADAHTIDDCSEPEPVRGGQGVLVDPGDVGWR